MTRNHSESSCARHGIESGASVLNSISSRTRFRTRVESRRSHLEIELRAVALKSVFEGMIPCFAHCFVLEGSSSIDSTPLHNHGLTFDVASVLLQNLARGHSSLIMNHGWGRCDYYKWSCFRVWRNVAEIDQPSANCWPTLGQTWAKSCQHWRNMAEFGLNSVELWSNSGQLMLILGRLWLLKDKHGFLGPGWPHVAPPPRPAPCFSKSVVSPGRVGWPHVRAQT